MNILIVLVKSSKNVTPEQWYVASPLSPLPSSPEPAKRLRKEEEEEFVDLRSQLHSSCVCTVHGFRIPSFQPRPVKVEFVMCLVLCCQPTAVSSCLEPVGDSGAQWPRA